MGLHRLLGFTTAVPDPEGLAAFYGELGLAGDTVTGFTGSDGGSSVLVDEGDFRQLVRVEFGCRGPEDLDAVARRLTEGGAMPVLTDGELRVVDPASRVELVVRVAEPAPAPVSTAPVMPNAPGATVRVDERAPAVFAGPRPPRRLGHLVIGTPAIRETPGPPGPGRRAQDQRRDRRGHCLPAVLAGPPQRCPRRFARPSAAALLLGVRRHRPRRATAPSALLRPDPSRHTWGLGRHFAGSNFYWYLRDPAGSYLELYSDLDQILDDEAWEQRGRTPFDFERVANSWGPDIPLEFIVPPDLDQLQAAWADR